MKTTIFSIVLYSFCPMLLCGQSYHFSQFYSAPLMMNPAFTGYVDGDFRGSFNTRSQWRQGGTPYQSSSVSVEYSPFREKLGADNRAGVGLSFLNDRSLNGLYKTNSIALSFAYNMALDADGSNVFGSGIQFVYNRRNLDLSGLTFENQFVNGDFDITIPVNETFAAQPSAYIDLNAGLHYKYYGEYWSAFVSGAAHNLLSKPEKNILLTSFRMPVRYGFLAALQLSIGEADNAYFSINHLQQASAQQTVIGGAYGIHLGDVENRQLKLGLWHRWKDAMIPYVGYQLNNFQLGLSYDLTMSKVRTGSNMRNAFELSFSYSSPDVTELKKLVPWY